MVMLVAVAGCDKAPAPAPDLPELSPRTAVAAATTDMLVAELPALVVQPPGARVAVAAPFAGLVRNVMVQPGQAVTSGQVLAIMVSREALELAGDLARAEARASLAKAEAARMDALAREGVVAGARADTARAAETAAMIDTREAGRLLARGGADADGLVRLRAPIKGRVASMAIEAGAPLDGMSTAFVIEAEGSRTLSMQVPERLAGQLRPGLRVSTADGHQGALLTIGTSLDPATRAFPARARLDNSGPTLTGGALIRLSLHAPAPQGAVSVPSAALVQEDGAALVFVKTSKGFVARPVTRPVTYGGSGTQAVITAGLKAGEQVAISNLPELRARQSQAMAGN